MVHLDQQVVILQNRISILETRFNFMIAAMKSNNLLERVAALEAKTLSLKAKKK